MARIHRHPEHHLVERIGWLRAAVLGANDGILSTASLIVGVAAAAATKNAVLVAGVAGLVAGAMSMATGEYVSVSSQSDTERADLARERIELRDNVEFEKEELTQIYVKRGVEPSLARKVAEQLMAKDALTTHAREELGISEITTAPGAGRIDVGFNIFGRRGVAFTYGRHIADRCNCPDCGRCLFRVSCVSRCNRSKGGRRKCSPRHCPSDVLGGVGDGIDRRNWEGVRNRCLMP